MVPSPILRRGNKGIKLGRHGRRLSCHDHVSHFRIESVRRLWQVSMGWLSPMVSDPSTCVTHAANRRR